VCHPGKFNETVIVKNSNMKRVIYITRIAQSADDKNYADPNHLFGWKYIWYSVMVPTEIT
jgi:hypothetical protein